MIDEKLGLRHLQSAQDFLKLAISIFLQNRDIKFPQATTRRDSVGHRYQKNANCNDQKKGQEITRQDERRPNRGTTN